MSYFGFNCFGDFKEECPVMLAILDYQSAPYKHYIQPSDVQLSSSMYSLSLTKYYIF